jgi:hypothetical protein
VSDAPDGPGDAPPPAPPGIPATRRTLNRTPLLVALGLLLAATAVGLILALLAGDDGKAAEPSPGTRVSAPVSEPDDGPTTTTEAPGTTGTTTRLSQAVDGLEVVDSGFSTYEGVDGPAGSYGLILENTSDKAVTHSTVRVVVHDTNDTVVASHDHDVAVVSPGGRLGLGSEVGDPLAHGIGRLEVLTVEGGGGPVPQGALTASEVSTSSDEFGVYTTFVVSSSYDVELARPHAYAVYRNAAGKIVGGANGVIDPIPPRGRAKGAVTAFAVVPDVARVDVYVDPGSF